MLYELVKTEYVYLTRKHCIKFCMFISGLHYRNIGYRSKHTAWRQPTPARFCAHCKCQRYITLFSTCNRSITLILIHTETYVYLGLPGKVQNHQIHVFSTMDSRQDLFLTCALEWSSVNFKCYLSLFSWTLNFYCTCYLYANQTNPPLPPVGPSLSRARLPYLKTSYSFTASALVTPPISGLPGPPTSQSFIHAINNGKSNKKTSSSPPLPRSRDQNQRNATETSLPQASSFQSRAATPPPRRKWDCSPVEPSSAPILDQSSVDQVARGHVAASLQSKSAMQLDLLVVPGSRRKDGGGSTKTSSKSSLSSRESTAEGDVAIDGTVTGRDWDRSTWTNAGGSSTVRPRNMDAKKKSTRQNIRSLFNLANSRDASSWNDNINKSRTHLSFGMLFQMNFVNLS